MSQDTDAAARAHISNYLTHFIKSLLERKREREKRKRERERGGEVDVGTLERT